MQQHVTCYICINSCQKRGQINQQWEHRLYLKEWLFDPSQQTNLQKNKDGSSFGSWKLIPQAHKD